MSYEILKGSTDQTRYVMLVDATAGTPEINYTITDLDLQYTRNRVAPAAKADATALAATDSAHADNKAIQVDATSSPGLYRVDWPDAAFATGVDKVILVVSGTGLHPAVEEIQLVNFNPEDGVRLGLTALPNAAADAAGGLPISDAGGIDLDAQIVTKINDILTDTGTTLEARIPAALTGAGNMKSDALAIDGSTTAATNLKQSATVIYVGSITGAASATMLVDSGLTQADVDFFNGRVLCFVTGSFKYQMTDITAFDPTTDTLTFTTLTGAPSGGDIYVIL